ncbi:MAG: tetraacyldisaccharide 4'-kinase [Bdellovibrionaceae bacterium]|jgi:tetraacyldisaccharide 4'-kinase|nr:tetraacyldisaccharide 4'-kinase [Pseudobdellovibrionaceae bacterium]
MSKKLLLGLPTLISQMLVASKNWIYDNSSLQSTILSIPIVSIGNLSFGGTGKTAVADYLISMFNSYGHSVGVISRGYGGTYKGLVQVDLEEPCSLYGDEPYMLKSKYPSTKVVLCKDRQRAYLELIKDKKISLAIADDAFQHRKMGRTLDIVIIDAMEDLKNYYLFPKGRLREPVSSLKRAEIVIINKFNLVESHEKMALITLLREKLPQSVLDKLSFFIGYYVINRIQYLGQNLSIKDRIDDFILVSGLGNPHAFSKSISKITDFKFEHLVFTDHHDYTQGDVDLILKKSDYLGVNKILTTEKDFVKLNKFESIRHRIYVTKLEFEIEKQQQSIHHINFQGRDKFHEILNRLIF